MLTSGSERRFELTKLVVDKLLFGLIVLSLGLLGKFWLDSRQAEADLRRALALTRATRLGEVWEKAYQLEAALESMPTKQRVVEHRREALDALRDSMMLAGLDAETADDSAATLLQHRPDLEAMGLATLRVDPFGTQRPYRPEPFLAG